MYVTKQKHPHRYRKLRVTSGEREKGDKIGVGCLRDTNYHI